MTTRLGFLPPPDFPAETLAAINELGANQRGHAMGLAEVKTHVAELKVDVADLRQETRARFRSVDDQLAEIKDLILIGRNGG